MKKQFAHIRIVLLVILIIGVFAACDFEGNTPLRSFYFTIDPVGFHESNEYYFIGYNLTTGGSFSSSLSALQMQAPGKFVTPDVNNLGDWILSVY